MERVEFCAIRRKLGKTQSQLAQLLGTSLKAVQSFEQGWRNVPVHIERQMFFLLAMKNSANTQPAPCWEVEKCPAATRERCPAWEFRCGNLCWFINGTICHGETRGDWSKKMEACRTCRVFGSVIKGLEG
ncbi:MAG: transcriptional regulator [Deltaproteobacteria bacterium]|nr:transcriptional regulator [Deltaproteobacteria bacterium]MBW2017447.1 transcriptional regulator [Deltaproteobacteria bacterium]MBW2129599.1 transcriptional regulator [Deltaproteobacteria bacterium]MBW2304279.1 transcriptional regulator [Deltaproteobacteria bacterium]